MCKTLDQATAPVLPENYNLRLFETQVNGIFKTKAY